MVKKPKRGRGRPPFSPTATHRRKVAQWVACGMSQEDICRNLDITKPTLEKYFEEEIKTGAAKKYGEIIDLMFKGARGGNGPMQRKLEEIIRVHAAAESVNQRATSETITAPRPAKLGKKEERQQAAESVTGKFAPPPPPKIVVNNG